MINLGRNSVQRAALLVAVLLTACGGGAGSDNNGPVNVAPTVTSTTPANNATAVATNAAITATFSEDMEAATLSPTTFILNNGATGTVAYSGKTATFTPSPALDSSTQYTAAISTGAKSATGHALAASYTWTFTTGTTADTTVPTISSTSPAKDATGVPVNSAITVHFSEAMNASTLTSNFTLKNGATNVTGTVAYSGTTATFTPSPALASSTLHTATVTTGAKDTAGNALANDRSWSFTTAASGTPPVSTTGWLYTKPNNGKIYVNNGSGEQVWVGRGVNVDDLFLGGYNYDPDTGAAWMTAAAAEQALLNTMSSLVTQWKPNFVRVSLGMYSYETESWLTNPAKYRTPMENVINALGANPGVYVLVTLRSDTSMATCNVNMGSWSDDARCLPTAATDAVYKALVDSFADKPYVLFGLSNEPGGQDNTPDELRAAMSHAVDVIRAREDELGVNHHIVVVQGNNWTSRLDFFGSTPLTQDNVAYEYHSYPPETTGEYGYTYSNIPVIVGEYGGANHQGLSQSEANTFFADVEAKQISTLAWSFSPYSDVAPDLVNVTHDGNNIQPNAWGNIVKTYLVSHAP